MRIERRGRILDLTSHFQGTILSGVISDGKNVSGASVPISVSNLVRMNAFNNDQGMAVQMISLLSEHTVSH